MSGPPTASTTPMMPRPSTTRYPNPLRPHAKDPTARTRPPNPQPAEPEPPGGRHRRRGRVSRGGRPLEGFARAQPTYRRPVWTPTNSGGTAEPAPSPAQPRRPQSGPTRDPDVQEGSASTTDYRSPWWSRPPWPVGGGAGIAVTGTGTRMPMPDPIRLAEHAHHYLVVYRHHTAEPLYMGRTKRLATKAQRLLLYNRDRGCTRPGCTQAASRCEAHHANPSWNNGGLTDAPDLGLGAARQPARRTGLDHHHRQKHRPRPLAPTTTDGHRRRHPQPPLPPRRTPPTTRGRDEVAELLTHRGRLHAPG